MLPLQDISLGNKLFLNINDPAAAGIPKPYPSFSGTVAQALEPYPQYSGLSTLSDQWGNSAYHAAQISVQKHFGSLTMLANYTISKWLTNGNYVGFLGYGVSLVLFVLALRGLGAARTGAYFSVAPFFGAALAIVAFGEPLSWPCALAAALMALGVWLHLTEVHEHEHVHEALTHTHAHRHDAHHQHGHNFDWNGREPHTHEHSHEPLVHRHPHYPDVHHRHEH